MPNYVNDQRHAYANDERFGFSPMSSLVLFLANKLAVVLTDVLPSEHHLGGCFHALDLSFVVRRVTETGTLSTAGENYPLDIGDMQCCARQESGQATDDLAAN